METINEFLRALGRIEGQLDRMDKQHKGVYRWANSNNSEEYGDSAMRTACYSPADAELPEL